MKEAAHQKQLDAVRQEAAKAGQAIHAEHQSKEAELQRQLEYVRKTAETEKERAQRRFEGERADLKATIARLEAAEAEASRLQRRTEAEKADIQASLSRLEVDLMKVCYTSVLCTRCGAQLTIHRRTRHTRRLCSQREMNMHRSCPQPSLKLKQRRIRSPTSKLN